MNWVLGSWFRLLPWVAGGAVVVMAWAYAHHQQAQVEALRQSLTVAEANGRFADKMARDNASALAIAAKQYAADEAALEDHYKHQAAAGKAVAVLLESINHAPPSDDGPVAPVLMRAFNCLREPAGDAAGARDAFCKGDPAERADGVPGAAGDAATR
jgi:hypothetical protein